MGRKVGEKEKFSFGAICDEKSEKGDKTAYGRLRRRTASVFLPQGRKSCKSAASRYAP